jgi:hypothetical protein
MKKSVLMLFILLLSNSSYGGSRGLGKVQEWGANNNQGMSRACERAKERMMEVINTQSTCAGNNSLSLSVKKCVRGLAATPQEVQKYANIKDGDHEYTVSYEYSCD